MKLLVIIIILYLAYRALKYRLHINMTPKSKYSKGSERQIDDIMVKDPMCEVYFPKRSGIPLTIDGKTFYFCSNDCKEKFMSKETN